MGRESAWLCPAPCCGLGRATIKRPLARARLRKGPGRNQSIAMRIWQPRGRESEHLGSCAPSLSLVPSALLLDVQAPQKKGEGEGVLLRTCLVATLSSMIDGPPLSLSLSLWHTLTRCSSSRRGCEPRAQGKQKKPAEELEHQQHVHGNQTGEFDRGWPDSKGPCT